MDRWAVGEGADGAVEKLTMNHATDARDGVVGCAG
jgi:hypothetical protein